MRIQPWVYGTGQGSAGPIMCLVPSDVRLLNISMSPPVAFPVNVYGIIALHGGFRPLKGSHLPYSLCI